MILAGDVVIGRVTAQNLLLGAWRKAELGYWIAPPYQGQGHATVARQVVAQRLGLPLGTVKTRMYHGLRALKAALAQRGFNG